MEQSTTLTSLLKRGFLAVGAILGLYVLTLAYGVGIFLILQRATGDPPLGYVYGMPGGLNPFVYGPVVTLPLTLLATLWAVCRSPDASVRRWYHALILVGASLLLGGALAGGIWEFIQIHTGNANSVDPLGDIIYTTSIAFGFSPLVAMTAFPLNVLFVGGAWCLVEAFGRIMRHILSLDDSQKYERQTVC